MPHGYYSRSAKDNAVTMWICLGVAVVLGIALVCAGIRITYVMALVNFSNYREPVLIAHGVPDTSDVDVWRLIATSRIYMFMSPWPKARPTVADPSFTAAAPLAAPVDTPEAAGYRAKALAGDVAAASKLGLIYYNGKGVPMNFKEALKWFLMAADNGDAYSEDKIGETYRDGYIVPIDYEKANVWFKKAADQGLPDAQVNLAWMYYWGMGVTKDKAEAQKWIDLALPRIQKAADTGDPEALGDLADSYIYGFGLPADYARALSLYRKAADAGDAYNQDGVGFMYEGGLGVPADIPTAVSWYKKAAAQGLPDAQSALKQLGY